jgi:hypothetical protein
LIEMVYQFRQPLAQAMREVGIAGPDGHVQLAFALDHPKFHTLLTGLAHLQQKVFQRRRRLGCGVFGADGCGLQGLGQAASRLGGWLPVVRPPGQPAEAPWPVRFERRQPDWSGPSP